MSGFTNIIKSSDLSSLKRIYRHCKKTKQIIPPMTCVFGLSTPTTQIPSLSPNTYYIALLYNQDQYDHGITDVINLIISQFPSANIVYKTYIVDGTIPSTNNALINFINLYPTGHRVTISSFTSVLNQCSLFFTQNKLDILSLSTHSTSSTNYSLSNVLTYGYYNIQSIVSSFYLIKEYAVENIIILLELGSSNIIFLQDFVNLIYEQNSLLDSLPITTFEITEPSYNIPTHSVVFILADTSTITSKSQEILSSIGDTGSYIYMTDYNYDIGDIFNDIPALVAISRPTNYTTTTSTVYDNLSVIAKERYTPDIYPLYDILYTLIFMSKNNLAITKQQYINSNPFQDDAPQAFSNSLVFDTSKNGFNYGLYYLLFTKNCLFTTYELNLYNQNNVSSDLPKLSASQSIFRSIGITPFFPSNIYYINANLIFVYNNSNTLTYIKYDGNLTAIGNNLSIADSENQPCKFIYNRNDDGFFTYLDLLYDDISKTPPEVNITMSKTHINKYIH
jgi:hypothetical protein